MEENVLVVEARAIADLVEEEGLVNIDVNDIRRNLVSFGRYLPRSEAESNEDYRQVIPYVAMRTGDKYLLMKRTSKQGEKRLHNKLSLGVGGHVNDGDRGKDAWNVFLEGMKRELLEEVEAEVKSLNYLGVINDLTSPVSRVHVGIAYLADVEFKEMNEPDSFEIEWHTLEEIERMTDDMEVWSRLLLEKLLG